jgi:glucose/arabinose dehydrogenase
MEPGGVTLRPMTMKKVAQVRWGVAVMLVCSLAACSSGPEAGNAGPVPSASAATQDTKGWPEGSTEHGNGSSADVSQQQDGAESAAGQIASGDGLRVKNQTGGPVTLIFRDGATAQVEAGKVVTLVMPCRERLPLRVESETGQFIAKHDGPCRKRETWVLG